MVDKHKSIFIEYCVNCSNHAWCTKHDEAKYKHFYELVQQGLEQEFQDFTVLGNCSTQTGKTIVPRLGAFEITFHDHVIFSKLKTSMWPTMDAVISRIKTVMKGGHINEYNEDDSHGKKNKHDARSARKTSTRGRERVQPPNYSYLDPHEGQARYQNGYREEFSMMEMSSKNRDESKGLPELNKMMMKRDMTPTRLEGIGMNNHFFDEKHYMKLAYLDANKRIVNLTRENQIDYLQKRYYTEFSSPIPNTKAAMEYPSMNTTYSPISLQNNGNNGQNSANDDTERPIDQYRKSGSVPISKRRNRLDESGIGVPDGTMYTDKTLKTEESEQTPQAGKKELSKAKSKESKDSKDSKEMKEQEKYNKVLLSKLNDTTRLPAIANIRNQKNTLQGVLVFKGKIIQEKDLLGLESVEFPEQKFSEIKIMKDKIRKKKITMIADTNNDCKIDIYATTPEILAMEANDVTVTKGSLFKIALQFGGPECEGIRDYYLFLFKNNKPWMKILIQLSYI